MKNTLVIAMIVFCGACTSLKPIEMPAEQLQQKIISGEIVLVGEKTRLITADGKEYKFRVTAVKDNVIVAEDAEVPIAEVVAVETRQTSAGKTTALVATGVALGYVIAGAVAAAAFLGGG